MLLAKPHKFLSEAATQDLMDPKTSPEVKDTVEELEDVLTNNVEEVKPSEMVSNGGIPVVSAESALLAVSESTRSYMVAMETVLAIAEAEAAEESEDPVTADPAPEEIAAKVPDVIEQIANNNGVDKEDITVVINAESANYIIECALNESKCGKKNGKAAKKAKTLAAAAEALKGKLQLFKKGKK